MIEIRKYTNTLTEVSTSVVSTYDNTLQGRILAYIERDRLQRSDSTSAYIVSCVGDTTPYDALFK